MKMDHHCPWINNCVGHFNHGHFVGFLASAVLGCAQASFVLSMTLYYGLNRSWYHYYGTGAEPKVTLTLTTLLVVMFALGLAIGVVLAVGALLYFQVDFMHSSKILFHFFEFVLFAAPIYMEESNRD